MPQITRLGLSGLPKWPYGSFAGKSATPTPKTVGITRLGLSALPKHPYGSFTGKTETPVAEVAEVTSGGISWKLYRDYYRDYLRKEKALEALPEPVRKTIERAGILKPIQFNPQAPSLPPSGRSKAQIERELKALEKAKRQKAKEQYAILLLELVQIELYYEWRDKRRDDELALLLLIS